MDLRQLFSGKCPICKNGLIFNHDYTKANCINPNCSFNDDALEILHMITLQDEAIMLKKRWDNRY